MRSNHVFTAKNKETGKNAMNTRRRIEEKIAMHMISKIKAGFYSQKQSRTSKNNVVGATTTITSYLQTDVRARTTIL